MVGPGAKASATDEVEGLLRGRLTRCPDAFEAILVRLEDKIGLSVAGLGLYVR